MVSHAERGRGREQCATHIECKEVGGFLSAD